ncbi:MAG: TatD family hydrolase [Bacteroidaceae bacterium]|nr:TatD family hydrolase [Bacteroidaceae bacterium]
MIDTHSHIYEPVFSADREEVIMRAKQAGVEYILLPNINAESIEQMLDMCRRNPGYCFPMMGLHPEDIEENYKQVLADMKTLLEVPNHPYIAIGEVGLDYYWDKTKVKEQEEVFRTQIEWAIEYHLPLMIHSRSAHRQLVTAISEYKDEDLSGVFHCFGGSKEEAQELLQFPNFMLGIGGVVTYKNSHLAETLTSVPLERIVLETDSPYLTPVPYRGKRNESAYVVEVLRKVAQIYNVSEQEAESITNSNAKRIFPCLNSL